MMRPIRRMRDMSRGFTLGATVGAVAAYFLDPDRGRARWTRTRDQALAMGRQLARRTERKARYLEGRIEGLSYRLTPAQHEGGRVDNQVLADKIRSEVLGEERFRDYVINVDAVDGVVHLRGEVPQPEIVRELRERVAAMDEVEAVDNLLHAPGTPAPNKQEALQAS